MASAAQLRALRKKFHLGEFKRRKRRPRGRETQLQAEKRLDKVEGRQKVRGSAAKVSPRKRRRRRYPPGYLGYPGNSRKENFLRDLGVPELGFKGPVNQL